MLLKSLLLNPPYSAKEIYHNLAKVESILPPLGLAYIAACLREHEIETEILDCIADDIALKDLPSILISKRVNILGITCITPLFQRTIEIADFLKKQIPDLLIVLGGPHPTIFAKDILINYPSVDICVIGEGEITFLNLMNHLQNSERLHSVKGIAFRDGKELIITEERGLIEDIDVLPMPARDLLPMKKYIPSPIVYKQLPSHSIVTSRGCPYKCIYCSRAVFGKKFRSRSPELVIAEIKTLIENYQAKDIVFYDDTFLLDISRVEKICDLIIEHDLNFTWSVTGRVNLIRNKSLLVKMKEAGCRQMRFGIETGNTDLLKKIKKGASLEQAQRVFKMLDEVGIESRANFMFALPGETKKMSEETLDFAIKLNPDYASFYLTVPFPGTELYNIARDEGTVQEMGWNDYLIATSKPVFVPFGRDENEFGKIISKAYKKFYLRPRYVYKHLKKIKSFEDIKRYYRAFVAIIAT